MNLHGGGGVKQWSEVKRNVTEKRLRNADSRGIRVYNFKKIERFSNDWKKKKKIDLLKVFVNIIDGSI